MLEGLKIIRHPEAVHVCRFPPGTHVGVDEKATFWSLTRTPGETSVVTNGAIPADVEKVEGPWTAFELEGPIAFTVVGLFAQLAGLLAGADVPIFILSTFDTDWLLVKDQFKDQATKTLEEAGISVRR